MAIRNIKILILLVLVISCVDPFEIKNNGSSGMLVVEGVISDQNKNHQVLLSRASPLDRRKVIPEEGATVTISNDKGEIVSLSEVSPGTYQTPAYSAAPGNSYTLNIKTADGRAYASHAVPFTDGPEIGDVYAKYINNGIEDEKGIQVFVDTEDPTGKAHYYRWNYVETYEVHAPFPSNWIWVGNNSVEFRYEGLDTCYVTDTLRNILLRSTQNLEQDKISAQPIRFLPAYFYASRYRYSILVEQFILSDESYQYWENQRTVSEKQGSLSDIQPGSITGNVVSLTDENEVVLGYFDAGKVSEKRIFFNAITFFEDGFKMPPQMRSNCYDISPIIVPQSQLDAAMRQYGRTMYIWEVYGFVPAAFFELMPKSCCDCRDLGPTERPSFF
jgi:hypothetical protein